MTYKTAKLLKDAGFPQTSSTRFSFYSDEIGNGIAFCNGEGKAIQPNLAINIVYFPTLSDLINACGDKFYGLHKMVNDEWLAFIYDIEDSTRQVEIRGKTPEEAVSALWLALNKK